MRAYLHLENGQIFEGESIGYRKDTFGELVFTTGMTGYPESLTDPSFTGQILVFTYPLIGNYGVPDPVYLGQHLLENFESEHIWTRGVIVSSVSNTPSHYDSTRTFDKWLKEQKVPGISGIDTRQLTLVLREFGVMKARISHTSTKVNFSEFTFPADTVAQASLPEVVTYKPVKSGKKRVLLIDCGVKHGIIRALLGKGFKVTRIPWDKDPAEFVDKVDGVVVSNGPGDPKDCKITIANIQKILERKKPFVGVCLGHQLLALAIGADTYKMPYGHRGLNQPCQDLMSKRAYVTSQNHGYAVKSDSIPKGFTEWFINLNDKTNEGLINQERKIWSTQFHPEGSPGPFDTEWVFNLLNKT